MAANILRDISHFMSLIMIPKAKELKLISICLYICDIFDSRLKSTCQCFSNNSNPDFTDQEVMTIYLYAMNVEQRIKIKQIHQYAKDCSLVSFIAILWSLQCENKPAKWSFKDFIWNTAFRKLPTWSRSEYKCDGFLTYNYLFGKTQSFCSQRDNS